MEVLIINKYEIKKIYKLSQNVKNERQLKKKLKEIYNIDITLPDLKKFLSKNLEYYNKKKYSGSMEKKILYLYVNCKNSEKLVDYLNKKYSLNLTYNYLKTLASQKGLKKKQFNSKSQRKVSKNTENEIIKLYLDGYSTYQLYKMYGYKDKKSILDILKSNNIERRENSYAHELKKTYLDFSLEKIDSYEKAYFIGLMITDGYVCVERNYIGIDLTDYDVIKFLSNYINVKINKIKPKKNTHKEKYRILIHGKKYVDECARFGIVKNKTFLATGCKLYEEEKIFIPYIIRGIIDGDGWIRKDGKEFFISSASKNFIKWCKEILIDLGMSIDYSFIKNEYNGIYLIRSASSENIEILKRYIYDKPFGMQRKYDRLYKEDVQRL